MIIHDITRLIVLLSLHKLYINLSIQENISPYRGDLYLNLLYGKYGKYLQKGMIVGMRRGIFHMIKLFVCSLVLTMTWVPNAAYAREAQIPHLIQTVTDQDIYEGLIALGFLETPVLCEEDCEKAFDNVKMCVVGIQMGEAHGSGIVWKLTPKEVVIATNAHVLEYWDDRNSYVQFPQGFYTDAGIMGVSKRYDVGFIVIDREQFTYEELEKLRSARIEEEIYDTLHQGTMMFCVDAGSTEEEARFHEATVEDPYKYITDFDACMLYGHGFAKKGMSGSGAFDGRGYLIGMTTGGTMHNEVACVPLPDLIESYEEVAGSRRQ